MGSQVSLSKRLGIFTTWLLVAVLIGVLPRVAQAQNATGRIVGTVADSTGAVVPDATVTVTNQTTGASRSMKTDASGDFNFELLPIGLYSVKVERLGFKVFIVKGITLQVEESRSIPVKMQLGEITQEVTVTDVPVGVDLVDETVKEVERSFTSGSPTNHARYGGRHRRRGPCPITEQWVSCQWQPGSIELLSFGRGGLYQCVPSYCARVPCARRIARVHHAIGTNECRVRERRRRHC